MFGSSFWGATYWGASYWGTSSAVFAAGTRDRKILKVIASLLRDASEFGLVTTSGPPEVHGQSAEHARLAGLELSDFVETSEYSDHDASYLIRVVQYILHIYVRDQDPDVRDDEADRLYNVATNALSGVGYEADVIPERSWLRRGQYLPADGIERRLRVLGQFVYTVPNWASHDIV